MLSSAAQEQQLLQCRGGSGGSFQEAFHSGNCSSVKHGRAASVVYMLVTNTYV
jgi:hypothetical protein